MLMRLGLAIVVVVLGGLVLLGIGAGIGLVQVSPRGIEFARRDARSNFSGPPKPKVVSADELLRQETARAAEFSTTPDASPAADAKQPITAQPASAFQTKNSAVPADKSAQPKPQPTRPEVAVRSAQNAGAPPLPFAHAPSMPPIRVDAGSPAAVRDPAGDEWQADNGFDAGRTADRGPIPIANTPFPELYRTERYDMNTWRRDVPNGKYVVNLHFAETSDSVSGPGQRIFHIVVQGNEIRDYDVFSRAGGMRKALVERFHVTVSNGKLEILFKHTDKNVPEINGIEVIPEE